MKRETHTPSGASNRAALSASRAKDYLQCPLLFRYRTVDRLPEPPSSAATRGTLVHAVLEKLFDLPATERLEPAAQALVDPSWEAMTAKRPELHSLFAQAGDADAFMAQVRALVTNYFAMENPRRLDPTARERFVEVEIASGILLRGFVDRIDTAPNGAVRVVDYKTGKSPSPRFTEDALFQMKFYGLVLWRLDGEAPARLQLVYLGDGRTLTLDPDPGGVEGHPAAGSPPSQIGWCRSFGDRSVCQRSVGHRSAGLEARPRGCRGGQRCYQPIPPLVLASVQGAARRLQMGAQGALVLQRHVHRTVQVAGPHHRERDRPAG